MDFGYSAENDALREEVRQFIAQNLTPEVREQLNSGEAGVRGDLVRDLYKKVAEKGWIGISWPKEYGGQDGDRMSQYIVEE